VIWLGKCYGDWRGITSNVINAVPTDTDDPYFTDDLIDDQEYPSNELGRVMEYDGGDNENNEVNIEEQKEDDDTRGEEIEENNNNNAPDPNPIVVEEEKDDFEGQGVVDKYNPRLLREMRRIDGFNPAANAYVNRYSLRTNQDQMHMAFFMVDHEKD
jgi:hypothetical protein